MIVTIPFFSKDAEKAASMLDLWSKLEQVQNHTLFLVYPHNTPASLIERVFNAGRKAFSQVERFSIPHEIAEGWPKGPNKMFASAAAHLRNPLPSEGPTGYRGDYRQPNGSFFWWEPDCIPLHAGCLDRLQAQYTMAQKPFLGKVVPTLRQEVLERGEVSRDKDGQPIDDGKPLQLGAKFIDGEHMVLVGMYDRAMQQHINWLQQAAEGEDPVDVALQNEICQRNEHGYTRLTSTDLIGHGWHTENYRVAQDGEFVTVVADTDADNTGSSTFQIHRKAYTGPAMIHGCKDESLVEIVEWLHGHRAEPRRNVEMPDGTAVSGTVVSERVVSLEDLSVGPNAKTPVKWAGAILDNNKMQSSPLNDPEHDTDDLSEEEMRIYARLQARIDRKAAKKVSKKTKGKVKKVSVEEKKQIDPEEVWAFYQSTLTKGDNAWSETLKRFSISPVQLSKIRKEKESLAAA